MLKLKLMNLVEIITRVLTITKLWCYSNYYLLIKMTRVSKYKLTLAFTKNRKKTEKKRARERRRALSSERVLLLV